nr:hypothetical protein [Tanacetum cinerariifolium]
LEITQSPCGSSNTSEVSKNSGSFEDSKDQMKKTLKTKHSLRREASRLHIYEDPLEIQGLHRKEIITKLMDVQGQTRAEFQRTVRGSIEHCSCRSLLIWEP